MNSIKAFDGFFEDGIARCKLRVLGEIPDRDTRLSRQVPFIGGQFTGKEFKHRGLTGSVGADQAYMMSGIDPPGYVVQDTMGTVVYR